MHDSVATKRVQYARASINSILHRLEEELLVIARTRYEERRQDEEPYRELLSRAADRLVEFERWLD